jgi:hypothetical protein
VRAVGASSSFARRCGTCNTSKGGNWRDHYVPGVRLCNACGVRWHKYHTVCTACLTVPYKEDIHVQKCRFCDQSGTLRRCTPLEAAAVLTAPMAAPLAAVAAVAAVAPPRPHVIVILDDDEDEADAPAPAPAAAAAGPHSLDE